MSDLLSGGRCRLGGGIGGRKKKKKKKRKRSISSASPVFVVQTCRHEKKKEKKEKNKKGRRKEEITLVRAFQGKKKKKKRKSAPPADASGMKSFGGPLRKKKGGKTPLPPAVPRALSGAGKGKGKAILSLCRPCGEQKKERAFDRRGTLQHVAYERKGGGKRKKKSGRTLPEARCAGGHPRGERAARCRSAPNLEAEKGRRRGRTQLTASDEFPDSATEEKKRGVRAGSRFRRPLQKGKKENTIPRE